VASPKFGPWGVLWIRSCPWLVLAPRVLKLCTNQLVWFMKIHVNDYVLFIFPSPISKLHHAPLPPMCYEPRSVPGLLALSMFSLQTCIWVYQRTWEHITRITKKIGVSRWQYYYCNLGKIPSKVLSKLHSIIG
jgi:hypothetical protein